MQKYTFYKMMTTVAVLRVWSGQGATPPVRTLAPVPP